ncbi:MAG: CDGSH iron-sulfur domain-containing protein [Planctomycetaceae bacterium]
MADVKVTVRDHGPFLVTGPIVIEDAAGNSFETGGKETVALCRCGASLKRPFCDGAHNRCGFESAERASNS